MSSTYLQLCQKFRKIVGLSGSGPASVVDQSGLSEKITIWVADADILIQRRWEDWAFLLEPKEIITATAGVSTFTLSDLGITDNARWIKPSFVRDPGTDDYLKLLYDKSYDEFLMSEEYLAAEQTGPIERVFIRPSDDAVIFFPTPTVNTTVWAARYKTPTRMSANTSTSPIPTRFEDAILFRAKMFYAEHFEDWELYKSAQIDYNEVIEKLEARYIPSLEGQQTGGDNLNLDVVVE